MTRDVIQLFNSRSLAERCSLVNAYGKTVWWTDYNDYRITLYEIDNYFVEVWFDIYNSVIWDVRMPTYEQLDIHLYAINIKMLWRS